MEELLNKLIEKGWEPRGWNWAPNTYWMEGNSICWNRGGKKSIRELVAKESGLWQFVCENGMVENLCTWDKYDEDDVPVPNQQHLGKYYEYRLIESALKDESELEQFLLDNIKV